MLGLSVMRLSCWEWSYSNVVVLMMSGIVRGRYDGLVLDMLLNSCVVSMLNLLGVSRCCMNVVMVFSLLLIMIFISSMICRLL